MERGIRIRWYQCIEDQFDGWANVFPLHCIQTSLFGEKHRSFFVRNEMLPFSGSHIVVDGCRWVRVRFQRIGWERVRRIRKTLPIFSAGSTGLIVVITGPDFRMTLLSSFSSRFRRHSPVWMTLSRENSRLQRYVDRFGSQSFSSMKDAFDFYSTARITSDRYLW